jgi:hypothetical protein
VRVGVGGERGADLGLQGLDLGARRCQGGGQRRGDPGPGGPGPGGPVPAGGTGRRGPQPPAQHAGRSGPAPDRDGRQPAGHGLLIERRGGVLTAEAGQERQADRAVQIMEQPGRGGERDGEVGAQLIAGRDPVRDQVLAGRTAARSVIVAGVSGISGRSRARPVRSVSAGTNASNRSSFAPDAP